VRVFLVKHRDGAYVGVFPWGFDEEEEVCARQLEAKVDCDASLNCRFLDYKLGGVLVHDPVADRLG